MTATDRNEAPPCIHPQALCESKEIGHGSRVGAFTRILPGARIGAQCDIGDHVLIENGVTVGNRVTIKGGVQLWAGVTLEDDVFVGPNATFTDMPNQASAPDADTAGLTLIRAGASIGANVSILPGVTIGMRATVGPGAVVTRSVPPNAVVHGNPAKIVGYVNTTGQTPIVASEHPAPPLKPGVSATTVRGVTLHRLREVIDLRGTLSAGELGRDIPFEAQRYFLVYDVSGAEVRGEHAHLRCKQFLIAVKGSIHVVADDGENREEIVLDRPNLGLYLPPLTWGIQYRYSADAVLLVLASDYYDAADYVRNYDHFLELARSHPTLEKG